MNILLPLDQSDASEKAVRFVTGTLDLAARQIRITLFHVVESLPDFLFPPSGRSTSRLAGVIGKLDVEQLEDARREEGEELLDRFRQILESAGLSADAIETKTVNADALPEARKVVAAREIIAEMKSGDYDVVVLGRRATSPIGLTSLGSVAEKVLREAAGKTVWIVD